MADDEIVTNVPVSPEMTDHILAALRQKGVQADCPECGTKRELNLGFIHHPLYSTPRADHPSVAWMFSSGRVMPTVQVICPNCGHVSQFAYRVLTHNVAQPAPPPDDKPSGRPKLTLVPPVSDR